MLALALSWWVNPPRFLPFVIGGTGAVLIVYGIVPGAVRTIPRLVSLPWKGSSVSATTRHGVTMMARLRWSNGTGKPIVTVDRGRLRSVWAALDIEMRNRHQEPKRVSDLFLEIRRARFPRRLIATADPSAIDGDLDWYRRPHPRRVEWLVEPNSAAITHHVRFGCDWPPDKLGPADPKRFSAGVVAELGGSDRQIRLELGSDIMSRT